MSDNNFTVTHDFIAGTKAKASEVNTNFADVETRITNSTVPIGGMIPWLKTFSAVDSGTTTSTTANKLVQTGQNFTSTVTVGQIIHNTTDSTFTHVTAIDSDTTLSVADDIFTTGETYVIYATPYLPEGWAECDGSVLSDAESPYNGATLPDLNGTPSFIRGNTTSGSTGGSETHNHQWARSPVGSADGGIIVGEISVSTPTYGSYDSSGSGVLWTEDVSGPTNGNTMRGDYYTSNVSTLPTYYEAVMIIRIK